MTCKYVQLSLSKEELNRVLVQDFNPPKITVVKLLEEMLLKGLSAQEKLKVITSTKFRSQSFNLLSEILKVSKGALYDWGRDIELSRMPKHYEHSTVYALTAYRKQEKVTA